MSKPEIQILYETMKELAEDYRQQSYKQPQWSWLAGFFSGRAGAFEQSADWLSSLYTHSVKGGKGD